ncbi:hypothetical protein C8Q80DRAFT_521611 [Daedaleopsis nitida]|nr:hypothetical protein C8Q80DRAFT_521611 [Daedaleopsis nitida]
MAANWQSHQDDAYVTLYDAAWGKQWPRVEKKMLRSEVLSTTGATDTANDVDDDSSPDDITYVCFKDIRRLRDAIRPTTTFPPVLVSLAEYEAFVEHFTAIERKVPIRERMGAVVIGQAGIGKTCFLLYLLLHRLERKLPTAIQFDADSYIIFDEQGVQVNRSRSRDDRRLRECCALVDSNADVGQPCSAFLSVARRIVQATSPKREAWKEWSKQWERAFEYVMDPPSAMEIAAIAKERGYHPSLAYSYAVKWGPSVRTVLTLCAPGNDDEEERLDDRAAIAARAVCADRFRIQHAADLCDDAHSTLLFVRPSRRNNGTLNRLMADVFVPTDYLTSILVKYAARLTKIERLKLFETFSTHDYTRTPAGSSLERDMHRRLSVYTKAALAPPTFFQDGTEMQVQPSSRLLSGVLSSLQTVTASDDFYWFPAWDCADFPGVDGVLGDRDGNLFALQVAAEDDGESYRSPVQGLAKLWKELREDVRAGRKWHVVFFSDERDTAAALVQQYTGLVNDELEYGGRVHGVWGCALARLGRGIRISNSPEL